MALLVQEVLTEKFSKPKPKKKWLQEYLEKAAEPKRDTADAARLSGENCEAAAAVPPPRPAAAGYNVESRPQPPPSSSVIAACPDLAWRAPAQTYHPSAVVLANEMMGSVVQDVIHQFKGHIGELQHRNSIMASSLNHSVIQRLDTEVEQSEEMARLLDPAKGGAKFNASLRRLGLDSSASYHGSGSAPEDFKLRNESAQDFSMKAQQPPTVVEAKQPEIFLEDIGGVVQGVISQFLNGSLDDLKRSCRKRCHHHKHNKHHHERSSKSKDSAKDEGPKEKKAKREDVHQVIQTSGRARISVAESQMSTITTVNNVSVSISTPVVMSHDNHSVPKDEIGALNLSLPKPNPNQKVTFAPEDKCYSTDSVKSFRPSKSQEIYIQDEKVAARMPERAPIPSSLSAECVRRTVVKTGTSPPGAIRVGVIANPIRSSHAVSVQGIPSDVPATPYSLFAAVDSSSLPPSRRPPTLVDAHSCVVATAGVTPYFVTRPCIPAPLPNASFSAVSREVEKVRPIEHPATFAAPGAKTAFPPSSKIKLSDSYSPAVQSVVKPLPKHVDEEDSLVVDNKKPSTVEAPKDHQPGTASGSSTANKKSSSTNREMHNRLEKNRRAHLKNCFDKLAEECELDPKKASNLTVIKSASKYIMSLRRKERENEKSLAELVQLKIRNQQHLESLKRDYPDMVLHLGL